MPVPNYRLTKKIVDDMIPDSHLVKLGRDNAHTIINRDKPKDSITIVIYNTGYMVAYTEKHSVSGVIVSNNATKEEFKAYAAKYNGINSPEQIKANMEALGVFKENNKI